VFSAITISFSFFRSAHQLFCLFFLKKWQLRIQSARGRGGLLDTRFYIHSLCAYTTSQATKTNSHKKNADDEHIHTRIPHATLGDLKSVAFLVLCQPGNLDDCVASFLDPDLIFVVQKKLLNMGAILWFTKKCAAGFLLYAPFCSPFDFDFV
jgi:hypothetical protein